MTKLRDALSPILLAGLLVMAIANYVETRRLERAILIGGKISSTATEHTDGNLAAVNRSILQISTQTEQIGDLLDCVARHRPPCRADRY
jgi:hypothetical protein